MATFFRWTNKNKPAKSCNATPACNVRFSSLKTRSEPRRKKPENQQIGRRTGAILSEG
ncbi:hypothetical protein FGF66_04035 [Chlorobaculum thiosulfatiphilum]|uniref:Uncharacterized protein n=1 Tax=Chlorobaculum thiosulfatiphilum TaxID=115852 RepID=A0A5C4S8P9_CHLTI|nr:hypothetical protein FGF66_04035 [Chlorobaculum thiosulfatiphilum]